MPAPRHLGVRLAIVAVCLVGLTSPALATKKVPKQSPRLDLELQRQDVGLAPAGFPAPPRGYAATLSADPWSKLEGHRARRADAGLPRRVTVGGENGDQKELRKVLDGETFPLFTIKVTPPARPQASPDELRPQP